MSGKQYEVEIKSLLGDVASAEALRVSMKKLKPNCVCYSSYTQINHYFKGGDPRKLTKRLESLLSQSDAERMREVSEKGNNISVRTRKMNDEARIVMKSSVGDDTSSNGIARLEIEAPVSGLTFDKLDEEVLSAGYKVQAKWSRSREEYRLDDVTVCLDKNAGYGYVAEFEKIIDDANHIDSARAEIEELMETLGVSELPQARLERMFAHYNEHWSEYYGTDKTFTIL